MPALLPDTLDAALGDAARDTQPLREAFERRDPFRHLVVDGFLEPTFARALLDQFPPFERGDARNENGLTGGKAVVERIRELGPAYAAIDDLVRSRPFLAWLESVTGIEDLRYDPWYFGGGTHENRHGQELDPHVDFNRHPVEGWHRRLNLIVYLNPEWEDDWGGALELHSDPRAADDRVTRILPLFNRAVLFETTEWSWHGFERIALPQRSTDTSRRSIALYFYTLERQPEETAPTHATIYVDRPLPSRFAPGHVLDAGDVHELQVLLTRRDTHVRRLYADNGELQRQMEEWGGPNRVALFLRGLRSIFAHTRRRRGLPTGAEFKQSFVPFVRWLPATLREPLRRAWRSVNRAPPRIE